MPASVTDAMERAVIQIQTGNMENLGSITHWLLDEIRVNPGGVFRLYQFKAIRSWYGTDSGRYENHILVLQLIYLSACVFGEAGKAGNFVIINAFLRWRSGQLFFIFGA